MDAMEAIMTRRSIRKYTSQPVSDELVEVVLRAAMAAPSAAGQGVWHFVVMKDHAILDKVSDFHKHAEMLKEAQVGILVCADPNLETRKGRWPLDCSAATENILLAAHAMGLGAVWVGIYPEKVRINGMRKLVGLPEHIVPLSLVSIGYPGESKPPSDRYDRSRIHPNRW